MVYGCNLPFAIVEHQLFKDMVSALRPGYKPPTRKQLGSTLLDQVHNKHQSRMQNQLKDKIATMQHDGWSTQQNVPVVATSVERIEPQIEKIINYKSRKKKNIKTKDLQTMLFKRENNYTSKGIFLSKDSELKSTNYSMLHGIAPFFPSQK